MPVRGTRYAKTILILDRELGFVLWLGRTLRKAGYQVLPAKSVPEAVSLIGQLKIQIDLVVADLACAVADDFGALGNLTGVPMVRTTIAVSEPFADVGFDLAQATHPGAVLPKPTRASRAAETRWLQQVQSLRVFEYTLTTLYFPRGPMGQE